ncbi:DUF397 domain-containing protein [Nocardiopsis alba]|uniref:DUF397 domain-containing protein n=1 Tax=Nocardiopsis alba TaxID=53437 RepID=UPI003672C481
MSDREQSKKDLPPEAMGNEKWHDTTDAVWMRSSLSDPESEAIVKLAEFDDGFRSVRDGKSPEKGTLFFTPAEWVPSLLLTSKAREEYERRQREEARARAGRY